MLLQILNINADDYDNGKIPIVVQLAMAKRYIKEMLCWHFSILHKRIRKVSKLLF